MFTLELLGEKGTNVTLKLKFKGFTTGRLIMPTEAYRTLYEMVKEQPVVIQ